MKNRATITDWLTRRYSIIVRSEENFADKQTYNLNNATLLVIIFSLVTVMVGTTLVVKEKLLKRIIAETDIELLNQKRLLNLSVKIDSLEGDVRRKDLFIQSMRRLMKADYAESQSTGTKSSIKSEDSESGKANLDYVSNIDSVFRAEFEMASDQVYNFNVSLAYKDEFGSMLFFPPLSGSIVTSAFDMKQGHYGIDLASGKNEPIKSVADGTVVMSSWTDDSGYVIAIQHKSNLITVYKHNSVLLKKVGNFVKAGDIIAIIGDSGEMSTGPHLHFELWYNGNPLNPAEFIAF